MLIGPRPMSVPMWRIAIGPNGAIPISVTDVILADTDAGTDAGASWSVDHRYPMLTDVGNVAPLALIQHRLPMSVGLVPMLVAPPLPLVVVVALFVSPSPCDRRRVLCLPTPLVDRLNIGNGC